MAVTLNAKGTSVPYFKIGKSGVTLYQGLNDPHVSDGYAVRTNDIWFDTNVRTLKFRTSENTWQALAEADKISEMTDVDLSGLADGHFLRYNGLANTWEAHEVTGGLASDWGSISENSISYDGYTGDVWQLETSTNTLSHNGNVTVNGNFSVSGTTTFVDVENINITNSFKFEGATSNDYELVLTVEDPSADRTITLPDTSGKVALEDNSHNTGAMIFPTGTTSQRPATGQEGMVRFNSETKRFEGYNGTEWLNIDIVDDWGTLDGSSTSSGMTYNYDFSNISYVNSLTFNLTDTSGGASIQPRGAFVHPDGTYYFWTDPSTDKVYRSEMSTAYDITSISGTPQTLDVSAKEGAASDVFLGDNGTKLYITGSISDKVHQYNLSTAYDLTTASFSQSITTRITGFIEATPWSLHFKSDGTKMYVVGGSKDSVGELDLSTAWDISTATFSQSFSFTGQSTAVDAFTMSADGTKMYHGDGYNGVIYRYSLTTAWDVSTASYGGATDLRTVPNAPSVNTYGIYFDTAGNRFYVTDSSDKLHQFSLE